MNFADVGTIVVFADDQYSLRLVAHFRTDMPAHIVISFIQVPYSGYAGHTLMTIPSSC